MIFITVKSKISEECQENCCYFFPSFGKNQTRQNNKEKTGFPLEQVECNSSRFARAHLRPICCIKLGIKQTYVQQPVFNEGILLVYRMRWVSNKTALRYALCEKTLTAGSFAAFWQMKRGSADAWGGSGL